MMTFIKWFNFFKDAGLTNKQAAEYSAIFKDHRIRLDMLKDLNKEYLFDMGIRTMGGVISILRHSKKFENVKVLQHEEKTADLLSIEFEPGSSRQEKAKRELDSEDKKPLKALKLIPSTPTRTRVSIAGFSATTSHTSPVFRRVKK